jgi:putative chitinase
MQKLLLIFMFFLGSHSYGQTSNNDGDSSQFTFDELRLLMPDASADSINAFLPYFKKYLCQFNITTPLQVAAFMATGAYECKDFKELEENLNYKNGERLMKLWPEHFPTIEFANNYLKNPERLGNYIYGISTGIGVKLGNTKPGDGYKFRGRGWFNGTGREFYQKMTDLSGVDFIDHPDFLMEAKYAVLAACVEWNWRKLNSVAEIPDFRQVEKAINGGLIGLPERKLLYATATKIFAHVY